MTIDRSIVKLCGSDWPLWKDTFLHGCEEIVQRCAVDDRLGLVVSFTEERLVLERANRLKGTTRKTTSQAYRRVLLIIVPATVEVIKNSFTVLLPVLWVTRVLRDSRAIVGDWHAASSSAVSLPSD